MNRVLLIGLFTIVFYSCVPSVDKQMSLAESYFIENETIITKKDALSEEIDYYKDPKVTYRNHVRSLTAKDLIHVCNKIIERNNDDSLYTFIGKYINNVDDIKEYALEYALKHPNKVVANEFRFKGIFTCYGERKYTEQEAVIVYIPKLDRYIEL